MFLKDLIYLTMVKYLSEAYQIAKKRGPALVAFIPTGSLKPPIVTGDDPMSSEVENKPYLAVHTWLLSECELKNPKLANNFMDYVAKNEDILKFAEEPASRWEVSIDSPKLKAEFRLLKEASRVKKGLGNQGLLTKALNRVTESGGKLRRNLIDENFIRQGNQEGLSEEALERLKNIDPALIPKSYWIDEFESLDTNSEKISCWQELKESLKDFLVNNHPETVRHLPLLADSRKRLETALGCGDFIVIRELLSVSRIDGETIHFFDVGEGFDGIGISLPVRDVKPWLENSKSQNENVLKISLVEKLLRPKSNKVATFGGFIDSNGQLQKPSNLNKKEIKSKLQGKEFILDLVTKHADQFGALCILMKECKARWKKKDWFDIYYQAVIKHPQNIELVPGELKSDDYFLRMIREVC